VIIFKIDKQNQVQCPFAIPLNTLPITLYKDKQTTHYNNIS